MKPVFQTITTVPGGNCLQACIASVLERPLEEIPHFCDDSADPFGWLGRLMQWLLPQDMYPVHARPWKDGEGELGAPIRGYCILGVRTDPPASHDHPEYIHAVVGFAEIDGEKTTFRVVHDPNPNARPIVEFRDVLFFVKNVGGAA